jgi:hypothetical protein
MLQTHYREIYLNEDTKPNFQTHILEAHVTGAERMSARVENRVRRERYPYRAVRIMWSAEAFYRALESDR